MSVLAWIFSKAVHNFKKYMEHKMFMALNYTIYVKHVSQLIWNELFFKRKCWLPDFIYLILSWDLQMSMSSFSTMSLFSKMLNLSEIKLILYIDKITFIWNIYISEFYFANLNSEIKVQYWIQHIKKDGSVFTLPV